MLRSIQTKRATVEARRGIARVPPRASLSTGQSRRARTVGSEPSWGILVFASPRPIGLTSEKRSADIRRVPLSLSRLK
jgi:hypothetical protein